MNKIKLLKSPLYGIRAAGDYSELLHERDGIHSTYLIKISIRQWSAEFYHKMYCRIHRSHLVNVDRVIAFETDADGHGGYAVLNNGRRFKVHGAKHLDSDTWNTDKSVCATETSFHAVAQTLLSVQIVQDNFAQYLIKRKSSAWGWEQRKGFAVLFLVVALATIPWTLTFAQEKSIDSPSPAMQEKVNFSPQHRIGWGISSSEGAVTFSNDSGEILISMLYARRITPITELELALHYTGIQRYFKGLNGLVPLTSSARGISIAWHADITFMMQPFTGFFQPLRLGLGPSLLLGSGIGTGNSRVIPYTATPPTNIPLQTDYGSAASLAMNAKAEWLFLQRPTFDIGGRVQLHLFTSAFSGGNQSAGVGGLGSAGVFAYVRF